MESKHREIERERERGRDRETNRQVKMKMAETSFLMCLPFGFVFANCFSCSVCDSNDSPCKLAAAPITEEVKKNNVT